MVHIKTCMKMFVVVLFKIDSPGTFLVVQWFGHALTAEGQVLSLAEELRSHKPQGMFQKKKKVLSRGKRLIVFISRIMMIFIVVFAFLLFIIK